MLIVASGPSAADVPLAQAKDSAKFVAINDSWKLCPWADMLYSCDGSWWRQYEGAADFAGLKVSQDVAAHKQFGLHYIKCLRGFDRLVLDKEGQIGCGGTSLFQALNIVMLAGPPRVIGMVGADMRLDYGTHWHGEHPEGLHNPRETTIKRWKRAIDGAACHLKSIGVTVLNLSAISALENYRKATLQEFLAA